MKKLFASLVLILAACVALAQPNISFTTSDYNGYNISCNRGTDGSITANVTGGMPPYSYLWSNLATTQTINNLSSSFYAVTVTDGMGATATNGINLSEPQLLAVLLSSYLYPNGYNVSLFNAFNGSITNNTSGGVSPYTYSWLDGPTTQNRTSVGGNILYKVTATDANGCTSMQSITLTEPERNDWTMTGNSGSNPPTHFIGTTDNKDMVFKTNGIERMRIGTSGGISTDRIRPMPGDSVIRLGDSSMYFLSSAQYNCDMMYPTPSSRGLGLGHSSSRARAGLSVAIGRWIDIDNTSGDAKVIGSGFSSSQPLSCVNKANCLMVGFNSTVPTFYVSTSPGPGSGTTGKVGIGTTTIPSAYMLAVNGKIICEEVLVRLNANWPPDYVFNNEYKLMSLKELEEYIKINKHLPEIPSASDMKKTEGFEIGDLQMKLLQKVEELTLYILEQQKQIDKLKEQVKK